MKIVERLEWLINNLHSKDRIISPDEMTQLFGENFMDNSITTIGEKQYFQLFFEEDKRLYLTYFKKSYELQMGGTKFTGYGLMRFNVIDKDDIENLKREISEYEENINERKKLLENPTIRLLGLF
jgi:hypothetical protein